MESKRKLNIPIWPNTIKIKNKTGLDPTAHFFDKNREHALNKDSADDVLVLHTNTNKYGMVDEIGTKDLFINGGRTQLQCKSKTLMEDICSHNAAWEEYSKYLKNNGVIDDDVRVPSQRFIICLDVSGSMSGDRLTRAIHSATELINALKVNSSMGLVTFNHEAQTIHEIVQIKGKDERNSLIARLPNGARGGTCISAGLQRSMEILKDDKFCSTIILISDGEPSCQQTSRNIIPELNKACITVNSVALGKSASQELEDISSQTNGVVHFVSESGENNIQQFIETEQAIISSYENGIPINDRPIHIPSKPVNNSDNVTIDLDPNIGTDITFYVNGNSSIDVRLASPDGTVFSRMNPEYAYDNATEKHKFNFDKAQPGSWNITTTKKLRRKRSIQPQSPPSATSYSPEKNAIKLTGSISTQTLEYPNAVEVSAELRSDKFPVIDAKVVASIMDGRTPVLQLQMNDDGAYPDVLANDGVYTVSVIQLPKPGRYSVIVSASSNDTAQLVLEEIDYFEAEEIDCQRIECQPADNFERVAQLGSIKLVSLDNVNEIPPTAVTDLRATVGDENKREINLEWSCVLDDSVAANIKRYDIRVLASGADFENAFQLNDTHIVEGSLDATVSTGNKLQRILVRIPDAIWKFNRKTVEPGFILDLKFALKTIGANNKISKRSNLASIIIQDQCETLKKQLSQDNDALNAQLKQSNDKVNSLIEANKNLVDNFEEAKEILGNETLIVKEQLQKEIEVNGICTTNLNAVTSDKLSLKSRLEAKITEAETKISEFEATLDEIKIDSEKQLQKEVEMHGKCTTKLNAAISDNLKSRSDAIEHSKEKYIQMQVKMTEAETKISELEANLDKITSDNLKLKSQLEAVELKLKHAKGINVKLETDLDDMKTINDNFSAELSELTRKYQSSQLKSKEYEEFVVLLNMNITDLNRKLSRCRSCVSIRSSKLEYENKKYRESIELISEAYRELLNATQESLTYNKHLVELNKCNMQKDDLVKHNKAGTRFLNECYKLRKNCEKKISLI